MPVKINGATSGSVTLAAPDTGSDVTLTLPSVTDTLLRQGGGKILQIVRATDTTERTTTSTSFVDVTGMAVTITPQKSDSAVLLIASFSAKPQVNSSTVEMHVQITDSSDVAVSGGELVKIGHVALSSLATVDVYQQVTVIARSTPATTSATTYKLRFLRVSSTTAIIANNINTGQMYAIEVSA